MQYRFRSLNNFYLYLIKFRHSAISSLFLDKPNETWYERTARIV